jgi:hypothetical protein
VLDLIEAGRRVADAAQDLGITEQTIYNRRRQDRLEREWPAPSSPPRSRP